MAGLGFEETELRLGLPGGGGGGGNDAGEAAARSSGKRGFTETIDLKLKLQPASSAAAEAQQDDQEEEVSAAAEPLLPPAADGRMKRSPSQSSVVTAQPDPEKPRAPKAQVVGWPPVRSFRKNVLAVQAEKGKGVVDSDKPPPPPPAAAAKLVKVSMDGAPYLRKVDLAMYKSYQELSMALQKLFSSFTIGKGMNNGLNESKLKEDLLDGPEYAPTYEDKDGDWMLVGDVPWEMFVDSCKRLRIMKGSEAIGLAPRAMEKCNGRS